MNAYMSVLESLSKPPPTALRYGDLPIDMQQLIGDVTDRWDLDERMLTVRETPVKDFPYLSRVDESQLYVDEEIQSYLRGVREHTIPPVVIVGSLFIDGCHRLTAARRLGVEYLPAINLIEIGISPASIHLGDVIGHMHAPNEQAVAPRTTQFMPRKPKGGNDGSH